MKRRAKDVEAFFHALEEKVVKHVHRVLVVPLFGQTLEFASVADALASLEKIGSISSGATAKGFEAIVEFTNGDRVTGHFENLVGLRDFLTRMTA